MAIGNSPGSQTKGTPFNLTINKSDLSSNSAVSGDSYFNSISNWKQIWAVYKSTTSNQMEVVKFDATESTPTRSVLFSTAARGNFEIKSIIIVDKQNGKKIVPRSSLVPGEFDVSFSGGSFSWDSVFNGVSSSGSGQLSKTSGSSSWNGLAYYNSPISGDFTFTANLTVISGVQIMLGYKTSQPTASSTPGDSLTNAMYLDGANAIYRWTSGGSHSNYNPIAIGSRVIVIQRTGSTISFKVDGVEIFNVTDSSSVYLLGLIYPTFASNASSITSSTLA